VEYQFYRKTGTANSQQWKRKCPDAPSGNTTFSDWIFFASLRSEYMVNKEVQPEPESNGDPETPTEYQEKSQ
jgi:hypothetical protein